MSEASAVAEQAAKELELENKKKAAWEAGKQDMNDLVTQGSEAYFKKEFPDLKHAFSENTTCVCCMDEGVAHKDMEEGDKLALAGSGILYPADTEDERLDAVAKLMIERGVKTITSHGGCGAAGLAMKRDFPGTNPAPQQVNEYARDWAKKLTNRIQLAQHEAEHVHIDESEMERPAEFHNARVVYFDAVGGFNPNKEKGLPMGFVIERKFVPAGYAGAELKVAASIAFGHHGLAERFTKEDPFVIVVIANSADDLDRLKKEADETLKDDENFKAGKIKVDGLII